ncbi:MAG: hypothetical protein ACK4TF_02425 [Thermodesulfovibrionales bacterium]
MRKISLILIVSLSILFVASFAFSASITAKTTIGSTGFTPSNKVTVEVMSNATQFGATSAHLNGNAQYGTCGGSGLAAACDPAKIYKTVYTHPGGNYANPTDPSSNGSHVANWTAL